MNPLAWRRLHRWDKLYWSTVLTMQSYYEARAHERAEAKAKQAAKQQEWKASLPKTR